MTAAPTMTIALRILAIFFVVLVAAPALAGYREALQKFAADSYAETEAAIAEIAGSGDALAAATVQALADGRLLVTSDRQIVIRAPNGEISDAATGQRIAAVPADPKPVRVNNRIRRAIDSALGGLTLLAADPQKRFEAAQAVFKARNASVLPTLEAALARETEPRVKGALAEARAAILLTEAGRPPAEQFEAVKVIAARGDADAQALLRGVPVSAPPAVLEAAKAGIASIEARQALIAAAQNVFYGISLGSVLLLAAIGLAITFGVMGIINMAHGEMVMIGAYTTFVVQEVLRANAPHLFDWSLAMALPLAFLVSGAIGVVIERGVIRFLYGRPLETLLATWGLSLILQQAVRSLFGPTNREVGNPSFMSGSFEFLGMSLTYNRVTIVAFSLAVFAALLFTLKFTSFGLKMRAVVQNRRMANSMGISSNWIDALTFGLGSGIAGIAGVALSQIDNVSPNLGHGYIIDSFLVVVFGGVGSLWGTLVAAMTIGIANKLLEPIAGAVLGKIVLLVAIILFIQKKPRGLFALKGRAVEA